MEKIFHFDSPAEVYQAKACVLTCFDARFTLAARKFLRRCGIAPCDRIQIPGAARWLAAPATDGERDFVLGMLATSIALHGAGRVVVTGHADCGAYHGRPQAEIAADVTRAAEVIRAAQPSLAIECYFFDFDGVYRL